MQIILDDGLKTTIKTSYGATLLDVFNGVELKTSDGETMGICMRDSGFEFNYNGIGYSAQQGEIRKFGSNSNLKTKLETGADNDK